MSVSIKQLFVTMIAASFSVNLSCDNKLSPSNFR